MRFRDVFDHLPHMLWIGRPGRPAMLCNKAWCDFVGVSRETGPSDAWLLNVHPDDRDQVNHAWETAVSERRPYESEHRLAHHAGGHRWVLARGVPQRDIDGRQYWLGATTDIDPLKTAEHDLALHAERYRALHLTSAMVLWIATPDGRVIEEWGWANLSAQDPGEFHGWGWLDAVHPDDRDRVVASWERARRNARSYGAEFRVRTPAGDYRWVEARAVPLRDTEGRISEWVGKLSDIHDRKQWERSLRASEERLRLAVESTALGIWDVDLVTGERQWNDRARDILGIAHDAPITRDTFPARVHPDDRQDVERLFFMDSPADGSVYSGEYRIIRADTGEERWVAATGRSFVDASGTHIRKIGTIRDITRRKRTYSALESSERRLRLALQAARMIAWEQDLTTGFVTRSQNAEALLGIGSAPLEDFLARVHPEDRRLRLDFLTAGGSNETVQIRYRGPDDRRLWLAVRGEHAGPSQLVGVTFDITAQKDAEEEVLRMAREDSLTGLSNRDTFHALLKRSCARARAEGSAFSLLLVDLDHFKDVNDTLGHDAGDRMLKEAAARMVGTIRKRGIVARFGGDEFAVLMHGVDASAASDCARTMLDALRQPVVIRGRTFSTKASIGIALFPGDGDDAKDLLKSADIALYRAKDEGRNRFALYEPSLRRKVEERIALLEDVRRGLNSGEIVPHYQPKVSLVTGRIAGFEALARWQHRQKGLLTPADFGLVFEDPDLARAIGGHMLDIATGDLRTWLDQGLAPGRVAINISPSEFHDADLADAFLEKLAKRGIPPETVEVEITEAVFLDELSANPSAVLDTFHEAGVSIALDDFGTGYASLSHLKHFPIDHIKIDRSFVRELERNGDDEAIVSAVIHLAHRMKMQVTAEGVETRSQAARLRELGCDTAQGFLYGRAMPAGEAGEFLARFNAGAPG
ncbi:EAL domain-containing protein [Nitratireductor sp. GCM10026969]|uniref:EAL domain-containing protein n=1 Tax=Nitratireductor sp. GCM10026969 TaxID=3252645 RepID=UPI003608C06C